MMSKASYHKTTRHASYHKTSRFQETKKALCCVCVR